MARVYISSTFSDLEEHRRTVGSALRRLGHEDVAMEYYVAEDKRPLDRCLSDVESCDVYVGIFAWRYGYIPNVNYPDGRSITELEYRKAREKGVPRLIFLLSEDALWPRSKQDKGAAADKIETLRQELASGHLVNMFESPDELARKVNEAIIAWEKKSGLVGNASLLIGMLIGRRCTTSTSGFACRSLRGQAKSGRREDPSYRGISASFGRTRGVRSRCAR